MNFRQAIYFGMRVWGIRACRIQHERLLVLAAIKHDRCLKTCGGKDLLAAAVTFKHHRHTDNHVTAGDVGGGQFGPMIIWSTNRRTMRFCRSMTRVPDPKD